MTPESKSELGERIDRCLKRHKHAGVGIAYFENGEIFWTSSHGFADLEKQLPVNDKTLFQAASISKPVSAVAALRLVEEGAICLDEDVNLKLKSWAIDDNGFQGKHKVTLRRLLNHSSGLNVSGFPGYLPAKPLPTALQILNGEAPANTEAIKLHKEPGTGVSYSGGGYVVLQVLLSDITGKPYAEALSELVLQPAGMAQSHFQQPLPQEAATNAAQPYQSNGQAVAGGARVYPELAAAGLWTTRCDLIQFGMEIQDSVTGRSRKLLSKRMALEMLTPMEKTDGFGLGFRVHLKSQRISYFHSGMNEGYECFMLVHSSPERGIAIMTNRQNSFPLIEKLARIMMRSDHGYIPKLRRR
ncbi:MAG TPA: serine hydrolase domain-containing protein [Candidatus Obscuribacterales bacterium]